MKRRLKRIGPLQAGKIAGVLYGCLGLLFVPFFVLAGLLGAFAQQGSASGGAAPAMIGAGMMLVLGLLMPIFYGIMGFVLGLIVAALYNLIARWVGGLEFEVE